MLTPMLKENPARYYAGNRPVFNREFYNPDLDMSLAQRNTLSFSRNHITDENGTELPRYHAEYETGVLYTMQDRYMDTKPEQELYFINNTPFETILQIVGKHENAVIVQDINPDLDIHFNSSPHYQILPSDFFKIVTNLDISGGRFSGVFTFARRGDSHGLTLA